VDTICTSDLFDFVRRWNRLIWPSDPQPRVKARLAISTYRKDADIVEKHVLGDQGSALAAMSVTGPRVVVRTGEHNAITLGLYDDTGSRVFRRACDCDIIAIHWLSIRRAADPLVKEVIIWSVLCFLGVRRN